MMQYAHGPWHQEQLIGSAAPETMLPRSLKSSLLEDVSPWVRTQE